jgi:anti-sigma B factor antagonist
VAVAGELDITTVPELDRQLRAAARRAPLVVLDLSVLDFVDSSGAALMLSADRRIRRAGGRFVVVPGSLEVRWLLALMGVERELELVACAESVG